MNIIVHTPSPGDITTVLIYQERIADTWIDLTISCIQKSFKKDCISNVLDGTADDTLWQDIL